MKPIQNMMAKFETHICWNGSYRCAKVGDHVYLKFEAAIGFQTSIKKVIDTHALHAMSL